MEEEKKKPPQFLSECSLERLKGHTGSVTALAAAPMVENGDSFYSKSRITEGVFASGSEDATIRIWDSRINRCLVQDHLIR